MNKLQRARRGAAVSLVRVHRAMERHGFQDDGSGLCSAWVDAAGTVKPCCLPEVGALHDPESLNRTVK